MVEVRFIGSGDAFGSGGRSNACISVRGETQHLLLDCGATSLPAMQRWGVDPGSIDAVVVSHLHGDHFGGLPFMVLHGQFNRRTRPLTIVGPPGTPERVTAAMEVLFPGSSTVARRFDTRFVVLSERVETVIGAALVRGYVVPHASGAPAYALRVRLEGTIVGYSGDGEWSDALAEVAAGADLFIAEGYTVDRPIKYHLSYADLQRNRAALRCGRLVLTHPGPEMLERRAEVADELADDGFTITI
jgi:ribonuclease BN (tRNA processing enzyme)